MSRWTSFALVLAGIGAGALGSYAVQQVAAPVGDDPAEAEAEGAAAPAPASTPGELQLAAAQAAAAGLRTAPLAAAQGSAGTALRGYARAVDLAPLAAIAAEIVSAEAALRASGREQERLAGLLHDDAGASQRELEAARAQATADRARLTLACQRVGLEYGAGLARLGCPAIPALARDAAAGRLAVVRLDFAGTALPVGVAVTVDLAPGQAVLRALGPASAGDSQLQSAGTLALVHGPEAARAGVGRILQATMGGRPGPTGVLVPRAAIVRVDGGLFVWRPAGKDRYERVALPGALATEQGWVVPAGTLQAGQPVVIAGAGTLTGLEHAAPAAGDD